MTITEAATKQGISKQAIYQRLKREGMTIDDIRNAETKQLTDTGYAWIVNAFNKQDDSQRKQQTVDVDMYNAVKTELTKAQAEIERLKQAAEVLTVKLQAAEKTVETLTKDKQNLQNTVNGLTNNQQLLIEGATAPWFIRWFKKK